MHDTNGDAKGGRPSSAEPLQLRAGHTWRDPGPSAQRPTFSWHHPCPWQDISLVKHSNLSPGSLLSRILVFGELGLHLNSEAFSCQEGSARLPTSHWERASKNDARARRLLISSHSWRHIAAPWRRSGVRKLAVSTTMYWWPLSTDGRILCA